MKDCSVYKTCPSYFGINYHAGKLKIQCVMKCLELIKPVNFVWCIKNMRKVHRNLSFQLVFVIILVFSIVSLIAGYFDIKFQKKNG